jgi:hypothetical protein
MSNSDALAASSITGLYSLVESQNALFNQSSRLLENAQKKIRGGRPPVQPNSEITEERNKIQRIIQKNAMFIQVVLFLVLLCAISYLVLPPNAANVAALIILGSAVIYRIFFVQ